MDRLAVLIDGDNFPHRLLPELIAQAQALGQVVVCRAFVNLHDSQRWQAIMDPNGSTELVRQPRHRPRKSSVDMTLAIHAMDLLHTTALDGFCIASNDSDFVPLVLRLQQQGVKVTDSARRQNLARYTWPATTTIASARGRLGKPRRGRSMLAAWL